jgi:hypothetical protein
MSDEFDQPGSDREGCSWESVLNRCRVLAAKIANELRNKRPEHFVDKLSLEDIHSSLERAAGAQQLSTSSSCMVLHLDRSFAHRPAKGSQRGWDLPRRGREVLGASRRTLRPSAGLHFSIENSPGWHIVSTRFAVGERQAGTSQAPEAEPSAPRPRNDIVLSGSQDWRGSAALIMHRLSLRQKQSAPAR